MMFKVLVLQTLYGLSDSQAEFQILIDRRGRRLVGRFTEGRALKANSPVPGVQLSSASRYRAS